MQKMIAACTLSVASMGMLGMMHAAYAADPIKAQYKADVAAADADYKHARDKCKPMQGNDKEVCEKEAKAAHKSAIANAKAARKSKDAHHDAAEVSRDQQYQVAKQKCDALSGADKDKCVSAAEAAHAK